MMGFHLVTCLVLAGTNSGDDNKEQNFPAFENAPLMLVEKKYYGPDLHKT